MKREIKFRAWNPHKNEMYSPEMLFINDQSDDGTASLYTTIKDLQETYELMQFTGLHDKNGKEVYEGDIVRDVTSRKTGYVVYAAPGFCVQCADPTIDEDDLHSLTKGYFNVRQLHNTEIIGNIYETPDLI